MFGKMSNSKWRKVFDEIAMAEVTIKTSSLADEAIIKVAEVCDTCIYAYNYPNFSIPYKDIVYLKIICPLEKAVEIQKLGLLDSNYENGILTINAYY